jgi:hypothetical protein
MRPPKGLPKRLLKSRSKGSWIIGLIGLIPLIRVRHRWVFAVPDGVCGLSPMPWNELGPWF